MSNQSAQPAVTRRFLLTALVAAAVVLAVVAVGLLSPNGDQVVQPDPPPVPGVARLEATAGSVAKLRSLTAKHPRLIHHYPFEGTSRQEKRQDCRGDLHLAEAVMQAGRAGGMLGYTAEGFDDTSEAIAPFRAKQSGNTVGVGLQSEDEFFPPAEMTVELLLKFVADAEMREEGGISVAIATRADELNCGFLVAVGDHGNLVHLLDGGAAWVESGAELASGDWYYLAVTFRTQSDQTIINTYLAKLDNDRPTFEHVVENHVIPGVPAASRLGIGKGFDVSTANAYPWSGSIDEVAVYDDVLEVEILQKHCQALMSRRNARRE